nr:AAA family ATPase [Cellulosimicrobium sp. MM]
MPVTILFANNKGGVQKTGCTVQTAAGLARQGLNVLVVDMDPQANATRRLGIEWDPDNPIPSVSEAIAANTEGAGEGAVIECGWKNAAGEATAEAKHIDVIPPVRPHQPRSRSRHRRRVRVCEGTTGWTEDYDVVLIDSARPWHLVQMSMSARRRVIPQTPATTPSKPRSASATS